MADMDYEFFESAETVKELEDGVALEHITCEREITDIEESIDIFGDPEEDSKVWSRAESDCSDSVMCEKYVSELLTGDSLAEKEIIDMLEKRSLFDAEYGCVRNDIGCYSEISGLSVTRESGMSVKDLCESLDGGEKIICTVSGISLHFPELGDMPGLSADSCVEVIGIEENDLHNKTVIINDPHDISGGSRVDMDVFTAAWGKGGCYAVMINTVGK